MARLLVACHNYVALVKGHALQRFAEDLTRKPDAYYGITQMGKHDLLIGRQSGVIDRYSPSLKRLGVYMHIDGVPPPPTSGLHQFLWHNDQLFVPVTPRDKFCVFQGTALAASTYLGNGREDQHHLNSVNVIDGRVFVLANNHKDKLSEVYEYSDGKLVHVCSGGEGAHNVWGEKLLTLSSTTNKVVKCFPPKQLVRMLPEHTWARGLAASSTHTYVGLSPGAGRDHRADPVDALIHVYDGQWKLVDRVRLPAAGQVHEIRLLDEPDAGHAGRGLQLAV